MHFLDVNFGAVLTAAVIQWVLGYLWYGVLFSKDYKALVLQKTAKPNQTSPSMGGVMALIFVANLILSFALAKIIVLAGSHGSTFGSGGLIGSVCGLGFVVPPMFAQHISEKAPFKLFGINALYWLIGMYISGGVLAIWQ